MGLDGSGQPDLFREHITLSASMLVAEKHDSNAVAVPVSNRASFQLARSQVHLNRGVHEVQEACRIPSKFILIMDVDDRGTKDLVTKCSGVMVRELFPT